VIGRFALRKFRSCKEGSKGDMAYNEAKEAGVVMKKYEGFKKEEESEIWLGRLKGDRKRLL